MIYQRVCNYINTICVTSGAETTHPSGHPSSLPVLNGVRVTRSLVVCVFYRSLYVLLSFFVWPLWLYVLLRFTDYGYPFGIFKRFLQQSSWILFITDISNMFIKKDETDECYYLKLSFVKRCFDTISLGSISQI